MNPCAASFGVQARELADVLLDLAHLFRIDLVDLDEGDDRCRDGGEDQRREDHGPQEEAVRQEVTRLLDQDRPDVSGSHHCLPARRADVARGRLADQVEVDLLERDRFLRTPTMRAPASTRLRTSSGLSPRGSRDLDEERAVGRAGTLDEREGAEEVEERVRPACADEVDPNRRGPVAPPQARRRVHLEQRAAHDPDSIAQPLRLVEVVRADHDRASGIAQGGDEVADQLGRRWVERAGRLVEVQHLGLVEQRAGDRDLLAHPLAEAADAAVADIGQPDDAEIRSTASRSVAPRSP